LKADLTENRGEGRGGEERRRGGPDIALAVVLMSFIVRGCENE
jgi:hypothetical protein